MAFTPYMEQQVLKMVFGGASYTPSASYSIGLSFTDPVASGITEPTGGGYARVTVQNNTTNFGNPAVDSVNGGYKSSNLGTIQFPAATADWVNGTYNSLGYYFIFDASSPANMIVSGALQSPKAVVNGDSPSFSAGQLSLTVD